MCIRRRFIGAIAVVTVTLQLVMTTLAMVSVCMERPHTHAGRAAPDCVMHHQQSSPDSRDHHAHHTDAHHEAAPDTSRIACRCSSDPLAFLVGDLGVIADRISVRVPSSARSVVLVFTSGTIDLRIRPLSPPPRPALS